MMENSKNAVLVASRKPSAVEDHMRPSAVPHTTAPDEFVPAPPPPIVAKPQFYFGQTMTDLVKKSSASNGYQTAIDKVKQNEALTHPKRSDEQQKVAAVTELNKKGKSYTRYVQEVENNKYKHRSKLGGKEVRQSYDRSVTFLVEPYPSPKEGSSKMSIGSALLLAMARIQALLKIEDLIWLNRIEELKSKED